MGRMTLLGCYLLLAAAGFEIADAKYQGRLYGAYTCVSRVKSSA